MPRAHKGVVPRLRAIQQTEGLQLLKVLPQKALGLILPLEKRVRLFCMVVRPTGAYQAAKRSQAYFSHVGLSRRVPDQVVVYQTFKIHVLSFVQLCFLLK